MKRGNTALKRGVGLASAFALAIAGAVLAAPAANAAGTIAASGLRATPVADAAFIKDNALITKVGDYQAGATSYTLGTGEVPIVGVGDSQGVSGFQVFVPLKATGNTFSKDDVLTVTLGGAEFASAPSVDITRVPVNAVTAGTDKGLDVAAGWVGSDLFGSPRASEATASAANPGKTITPLPANRAARISAAVNSSDATKLEITAGADAVDNQVTTSNTNTAGYLITVSGVAVKVKDTAAAGPITVGDGTDSTTIGYVAPLAVSIADDGGYTVLKSGNVVLPDVSIAETAKDAFVNGAGKSVVLTASGDAQEVVPVPTVQFFAAGNASDVNGNATSTGLTGTPKVDTVGVAAGAEANKLESTTLSGAEVSGLKAGSDLTVTASDAALTPTQTTTGALKSYTKAQTGFASLTIKQDSSAPRIAGTSRYATAADIAAELVPSGNAKAIILANGLDAKQGVDALSGNYLAGLEGAPILLTDSSDNLPQETQDAIVKALKNSTGTVTLYVLGGTDSVSAAAVSRAEFIAKAALNSSVTLKTVRLDGSNRFETSAKVVAQEGKAKIGAYNMGKGTLNTAFLASGLVNADALSAGALSAGLSIPVLLTNGTELDESVAKAIKDNEIKQVIILGGTDRVSEALAKALVDDHGVTNVVRVAGSDRYETAAALNVLALKGSADGGLSKSLGADVYIANGAAGFPDALAVGPLVGQGSDSLLTVGATDTLPAGTAKFLTDNKANLDTITGVGGADRVKDAAVAAAQKAIGF